MNRTKEDLLAWIGAEEERYQANNGLFSPEYNCEIRVQIRKLIEKKLKATIYKEHIREFLIDLDDIDELEEAIEFLKEWLECNEDVEVVEK